VSADQDPRFEALLQFLKSERGADFTGYKRPSLQRRVDRRLNLLGLHDYDEYLEYLTVHPTEFPALFATVLINVTRFFRDAEAWDYLAQEAIPKMLEARPAGAHVRAWSAGCASGEEAYTIAIVLAEILGVAAFLERVKIYATDVDEEALAKARAGYSLKEVDGLAPELLDRYFELHGSRYVFRPDLRRTLIFGRHDLVQDAPISKLDLLACRNTLMYFTAPTQAVVLERLHYALNPTGLLVLGKAEMLLTHADLFRPASLKHHVFTKVETNGARDKARRPPRVEPIADGRAIVTKGHIRDLAQDLSPVAQMTVDAGGDVVSANAAARRLFGITQENIDRPLRDLEVSYRPVELRSRIEEATLKQQTVTLEAVEMRGPGGEALLVDVRVSPLLDADGAVEGCSISFTDVTRFLELQHDLERSRQDLETAYEELQSANEELQTTNEELQSTVEELETTNEELQSSNEELETMNEELESTNSELQTINSELHVSTTELESFKGFTDSIFAALGVAVIGLDENSKVRSWNRRAEELWGVRADEALGELFFGLDIGLPVSELRDLVKAAAAGGDVTELVVNATSRRGKAMRCRVRAARAAGSEQAGVALLVEELAG